MITRFRFWLADLIYPGHWLEDRSDKFELDSHQEFIAKQELYRPGFSNMKFWEELEELRQELEESIEKEVVTDNLINELGDFLFCVLGRPDLAQELEDRLNFDTERARKRLDRFIEEER
jgi:uncharacterized protein YabN with tetrapyrrole methylase and pyrophosphatase domain